jgi:hypothetical protein
MQVLWERLSPTVVDQMAAVLLSLDNPDAQRIDGRGGDGGRDAQFRHPDGVDFFEIKSFADRVDTRRGRRANVENSLARAAMRSPRSWTLVVPVDPTDDEEAWFDSLRSRYGFPLRWWGLTWLSAQLARYPEVGRYYVQDERDTLLRLLREYDAMGAVAVDVPSALSRLDALQAQVRLLDPHLLLEITTLPVLAAVEAFPGAVMYAQRPTALGPVTVVALPRYPGAARDSELPRMQVALRFPDSEEGRAAAAVWEGIHAWGEPGELDGQFVDITEHTAPAGLGGSKGPATLTFARRTPPAGPRSGTLCCLNGGRRAASLPVTLDHLGAGDTGISFSGQDASGSLTFRGRFGPPRVSLTLSCVPVSGVLPAAVLPALRLRDAARQGAEVELVLEPGGETIEFGTIEGTPDPPEEPYHAFLENLAALQDLTRTPFAVPESASEVEAAEVARLATLLRDGLVDEPTEDTFALMLRPGSPSMADDGYLLVQEDAPAVLFDQQIEVGLRYTVLGPCRVEATAAEHGPPGTTQINFVPEPGARRITRLGPTCPDEDDPPQAD